jgi:hypothetical protein
LWKGLKEIDNAMNFAGEVAKATSPTSLENYSALVAQMRITAQLLTAMQAHSSD